MSAFAWPPARYNASPLGGAPQFLPVAPGNGPGSATEGPPQAGLAALEDSANVRRARYLDAAYDLLRAELIPEAPHRDHMTLAYSFPSKRAAGKRTTLGECHYLDPDPALLTIGETLHPPVTSHLVVIHPFVWTRGDGEVLAVLAHEMLHSALGKAVGHKVAFATAAKAIGLDGKPTATIPGERFIAWVVAARARLPEYPGGADIRLASKAKQPTRLRKWVCQGCEKPVIVRVASDEFKAQCLVCGTDFAMGE